MTRCRIVDLFGIITLASGCGGAKSASETESNYSAGAGGMVGVNGATQGQTGGMSDRGTLGGRASVSDSTAIVVGGSAIKVVAGSGGSVDSARGGASSSTSGGAGWAVSGGAQQTLTTAIGGIIGLAGSVGSSATTTGGASSASVAATGGMAGGSVLTPKAGASGGGGVSATGGTSGGGTLDICIVDGIGYRPDVLNSANACQSCQPEVSSYGWSPLPDGTNCNPSSVCVNGVCSAGCWIDSKYSAAGTVNPANACEICDPTQLRTTWSRVAGADCGPVVSAGYYHTCAVINGRPWCWGSNIYGQLGDGTTTDSSVPVAVQGLSTGVTAVSAGSGKTCAIANEAVYCWGSGYSEPRVVSGFETGATAVSVGPSHACAVVRGAAWCWGANENGQLGNNSYQSSTSPVPVKGLDSNVTAIAAGKTHSCATVGASVYCWGGNATRQLGFGGKLMIATPTRVDTGGHGIATSVEAGEEHTCAILDGEARCWGYNIRYQIGVPIVSGTLEAPIQVQGIPAGATAISTTYQHTCAIVNDVAKCWGGNPYGQIGNASDATIVFPPATFFGLSGVATSVSAGYGHSCVVVDRKIYCAGENSSGQLGNGATTSSLIPVAVRL